MATTRERLHALVDELPEDQIEAAAEVLDRAGAVQVEHIGIWVQDLERARAFYERWFGAAAGSRYSSARRPMQSYFLTLSRGARLELMQSQDEQPRLAHVAIRVGSREAVDRLASALAAAGTPILSAPRRTGDGYYEAVIADSEGNPVELIA